MSTFGVPDFAGTIVTSSDELAAILVESAIGQGQEVSSENFEKGKPLFHVFLLLLNQFLDELFQLGFAGGGNERLFQEDLVDKPVDVSATENNRKDG